MFKINDDHKRELEKKEITVQSFFSQLEKISTGSSYIELDRPSLPYDGIKILSTEEQERMISIFSKKSRFYKISKFVPASGAATRMFKTLFEIRHLLGSNSFSDKILMENYENNHTLVEFETFLKGIYLKKFAFSEDIYVILKKIGLGTKEVLQKENYSIIVNSILDKNGLDYGNTPKALIKFHKYQDTGITPLEEHISETCLYMGNDNREKMIHFTLSDQYNDKISLFLDELKIKFSKIGMNFSYEISSQNKNTDTVAIDLKGNPVTTPEGKLLFRPGGHGSLLYNLNNMDNDLIFIKNIDNITTYDRINSSVNYKKIMGGMIIEIREKVFKYLNLLPEIRKDSEIINDIYCYSKDVLNIGFSKDFSEFDINKKKEILKNRLNRPIRVCGMVENRGEPGGGPFWIKGNSGENILQIVEKAQINTSDLKQMEILKNSKYFNPVDIVCSITDFKGEKFHLPDFSDETKYFVSEKDYNGEKIRVLEHPGLWNGAMYDWITIFVETPVETFNPVKSVNDLLKNNHIPKKNICFYSR